MVKLPERRIVFVMSSLGLTLLLLVLGLTVINVQFYTVEADELAAITLSPAIGPGSNSITVRGANWPPDATLTIYIPYQAVNYQVTTIKTDNQGEFDASFFLPSFWMQATTVTVGATSGEITATAIYTVTGAPTPTPTAAPTAPQGIVTAAQLNVRRGPGAGYAKVGLLAGHETVQITGQYDGWWQINYPNVYSQFGWVAQPYINATHVDNVPVVAAPPLPPTPTPTPSPPASSAAICNPGQWSGCGGASCQADYVAQCDSNGQWGQCTWDPGHCPAQTDHTSNQFTSLPSSCAVYDPTNNVCKCYYNQSNSDPDCSEYNRDNSNYQWYPQP